MGTSCYSVPRVLGTSIPGTGPPAARLYTWWDARYLCKEVLGPHADLAVITTDTEMTELTKLLHNHFGGKFLVFLWNSMR